MDIKKKCLGFMNNINGYIKKNSTFILYTALRLITTGMSFLVNIIIVRKLSIDDYGLYSITIMLLGFATTFGFSWSSSAILYFGSKEKAEDGCINKTFWSRNAILAVSFIIVSIIILVFKHKINAYASQNIVYRLLLWLGIQMVVDFLNQYYLTVQKQILACSMYLVSKIILLIGALIIAFKSPMDIINLNIFTDCLMILFILKVNKKDFKMPVFNKDYLKEILNFSLWQLFGFSGLYLTNFGDNWVIKYYLNNRELAIYNSAYKLYTAFGDLSYLIVNFYGAYIIEKLKLNRLNDLKDFYFKQRFMLWGIISALHIVIILGCFPLIKLIYGYRYIESVPMLQILLVGSILRYFTVFYIPFCNATKGYVQLQILNLVQASLNIVLDVIFVRNVGTLGAAVATATAVISVGVFEILYFEKRLIRQIYSGNINSENALFNFIIRGKGILNLIKRKEFIHKLYRLPYVKVIKNYVKKCVGKQSSAFDDVKLGYDIGIKEDLSLNAAQKVFMNWPTYIKKPYIGLVKESDIPGAYWPKYERFLKNNDIKYDYYDVHSSDFIEQARKFDVIIWRTLSNPAEQEEAASKIRILENNMGKLCLPNEHELWIYENKINEYYLCKANSLPAIKTFISNSEGEALDYIKGCEYPFVSKITTGSSSEGVDLIKSYKQAKRLCEKVFNNGKSNSWPYIKQKNYVYFQEFIPDAKFDLRVIIVGNNYFGYYRYVPKNDFRVLGGKDERFGSIPEETMKLAKEVKNSFKKCRLIAVDFLFDNRSNQYRILETSIFPGVDFPSETIVNGKIGRYVYRNGSFTFVEGKVWIQELALREVMMEWIEREKALARNKAAH
jgi:O-antigen/teichoic acid export membrane protein/glutathione synthase/RimK-type ligase-like ATP-grasp enzyme